MPKRSLEECLAKRAKKQNDDTTPDDDVNKSLDREFDAQFCLPTPSEEVVIISINLLRPYSKHPFKVPDDENLEALADSIKCEGLQQPIIIRPVEGQTEYEILAGHRRTAAMKKLGRRDIKAVIRIMDDDRAALVVVNTNLKQREKLLPSEKAFAYKLQMKALQNGKTAIIKNDDLSCDSNELRADGQNGHQAKTRDKLAESIDEAGRNIQRYIRLTHLLPELLDLLDQDRYPVMAGYEVSFLDSDAQHAVLQYFFQDGSSGRLNVKTAETIRAAYQSGKQVTTDTIPSLLHKPVKRRGPVTYKFSRKELMKKYLIPDDFDLAEYVRGKLSEDFGENKPA